MREKARKVVDEGIATEEAVNLAMREGRNLPVGPLEGASIGEEWDRFRAPEFVDGNRGKPRTYRLAAPPFADGRYVPWGVDGRLTLGSRAGPGFSSGSCGPIRHAMMRDSKAISGIVRDRHTDVVGRTRQYHRRFGRWPRADRGSLRRSVGLARGRTRSHGRVDGSQNHPDQARPNCPGGSLWRAVGTSGRNRPTKPPAARSSANGDRHVGKIDTKAPQDSRRRRRFTTRVRWPARVE
jgi:hypothetical protein